MAGTYAKYSGLGGGGGSTGNTVTGPTVSVVNGVPVFGNTTGNVLLDSLATQQAFVPAGNGIDGNATLGLAFVGPAGSTPLNLDGGTGWKVVPVGAIDFLELFVQGINLVQMAGTTSPPSISYESGVNIRPDTSNNTTNFGGSANSFNTAFFTKFSFGGTSNNQGSNPQRKFFMYDNEQSAGTNFPGPALGFDSSTGSEWYWGSVSLSGGHYVENFNVICNTQTMTTVSAPANAVADATNAFSLTVSGANKTAGTGNGGDLLLSGGASAGGVQGSVFLANTSGAPAFTPSAHTGFSAGPYFDPATNKLYMYNGTAWVSTTLS